MVSKFGTSLLVVILAFKGLKQKALLTPFSILEWEEMQDSRGLGVGSPSLAGG